MTHLKWRANGERFIYWRVGWHLLLLFAMSYAFLSAAWHQSSGTLRKSHTYASLMSYEDSLPQMRLICEVYVLLAAMGELSALLKRRGR